MAAGTKALRIALIGVGAVGSTVAQRLAAAGHRSVTLIDPQTLDDRNCATSPFLRQAYETHAAGCPGGAPRKVDLVAREAEWLGAAGWVPVANEIADTGWGTLAACDVLCCCTDSVLSRVETAYVARMLGRPMLEAGVLGAGEPACRTAWFPPSRRAACYLCGLREDRRAQVLAFAASAALGCAPLPEAPAMTGAPAAVEHAANGLLRLLRELAAGNLPAHSAVVWRSTGRADGAGALCWQDEPVRPARSLSCPWHGDVPSEFVALPWEAPLEESLTAAGRARLHLQLAWPLCTEALCTLCGHRSKPMERVARVRRSASCPCCGTTGVMEPMQTVEVMPPGHPLRARSPRELGQPRQHLSLVREAVFFSQQQRDPAGERQEHHEHQP